MERTSVYCQNCRAENSLRNTHCENCGTRLLLVVFPQSLQYDTNHVPSFYEDHLLERVSLLELRLVQMSESLRIAMEIIREQGKIVKENQQQLRQLNKKLGGHAAKKSVAAEIKPEDKTKPVIQDILAEHDSPNIELFTKLLRESLKLLGEGEEKEAFRMLERAALLSPRNVPLCWWTAQTYFFADKFAEARKYLEKAFELAPDNLEVLFLLGTIYADEGETEKARLFLSILADNEKSSPIVNFIWGILAASEENWTESLAAFKVSAEGKESAEIEYLMGCVCFQQTDFASALRYFKEATSVDENYSDAWFMQALIHRLQADEKEKDLLANALRATEPGAQCTEFVRKKRMNLEIALPFQHFKKAGARLLTGGALRLTKYLKSEIRKTIE